MPSLDHCLPCGPGLRGRVLPSRLPQSPPCSLHTAAHSPSRQGSISAQSSSPRNRPVCARQLGLCRCLAPEGCGQGTRPRLSKLEPPQDPTSSVRVQGRDPPGYHQELVNLLVYERVVRLPHLGLQSGLVTAVLLTCTKHNGDPNETLRPPQAHTKVYQNQGSARFWRPGGRDRGPLDPQPGEPRRRGCHRRVGTQHIFRSANSRLGPAAGGRRGRRDDSHRRLVLGLPTRLRILRQCAVPQLGHGTPTRLRPARASAQRPAPGRASPRRRQSWAGARDPVDGTASDRGSSRAEGGTGDRREGSRPGMAGQRERGTPWPMATATTSQACRLPVCR